MTSPKELSVDAYLQRIGCGSRSGTTIEFLAELQERHLHSVPYENLDVLAGKELSLRVPALYEKIVLDRRGGYCFELNALFAWLLQAVGFEVIHYVARFWRDEPNPPPKRRHHVLGVKIGAHTYLTDVGVGGIVPRRPVRLVEGEESPQGDECYRMDRDPRFGWLLMELKRGTWNRVYSFTEEPQEDQDFAFANFWCQQAPTSIFRQGAMLAIRTKDGRNSVSGREFRLFRSHGVESFTPVDPVAYRDALLKHFGLRLPSDFPWEPVRL